MNAPRVALRRALRGRNTRRPIGMIPQRMYIVPLEGADVRFLGGSARARNARVAARAGAAAGVLGELPAYGTNLVLLVPPGTALMLPLFSDPAVTDAAHGGLARRLDAPDGASVYLGPAAALAPLAGQQDRLEALPRHPLASDCVLTLTTGRARQRATTVALLATGKASDGVISRTFNRPISRACSRVALSLGMSATAASVFTLLVGLACAWIAAQPGYLPFVLTGVLFHLASVLDGVDGEIARATLTESEQGARVDTVVDQLTYVTCFAGMVVGWVREGSGRLALLSAVFIGLALLASLVRAGRFVAQHAENASFVWVDRSVRRAAADTGRLPLRAAAGLFTLLRRDLFAVIFLGVSLTGQRVLVPALILAGVLVANLTMTVYATELADAAAALRARR